MWDRFPPIIQHRLPVMLQAVFPFHFQLPAAILTLLPTALITGQEAEQSVQLAIQCYYIFNKR